MNALSQGLSGPDAADLAAASLAMARRFASGATLWCATPSWPWHAQQVAVELAQPMIAGGRALPAVTVPGGQLLEGLRTHARAGDVLLLVARSDEPSAAGLRQRTAAWGYSRCGSAAGPRPLPGAADYVLWMDNDETISSYARRLVPLYRLLWKMTHDQLEHPELLGPSRPDATMRYASRARTRDALARWSRCALTDRQRSARPPGSKPWTRAWSTTPVRATSC